MTNNNEDFDLLKKLDENINQPDKFAEVFCNAASKQVQIRDTLKTLILETLKTDNGVKQELKKICSEIFIDSMKKSIKSIWIIIAALPGYIKILWEIFKG